METFVPEERNGQDGARPPNSNVFWLLQGQGQFLSGFGEPLLESKLHLCPIFCGDALIHIVDLDGKGHLDLKGEFPMEKSSSKNAKGCQVSSQTMLSKNLTKSPATSNINNELIVQ